MADLTGYIRGMAIVATVDSVLIGLGLAIMGVPLVLPLAVLTFMAAFFPLVGAFLAGLVAALVALVAKGWVVALVVVVIITLVQQLEGDIIYPVVVGRAIASIRWRSFWRSPAGRSPPAILGALLAPPVVAVALDGRLLPAQPPDARAHGGPRPARPHGARAGGLALGLHPERGVEELLGLRARSRASRAAPRRSERSPRRTTATRQAPRPRCSRS